MGSIAASIGQSARSAIACRHLFVTLVFGALAHAACAAPVIGGVCVPDSYAIKKGIYETAGFGVRMDAKNVGSVRLLCPLDQDLAADLGQIAGMWMTYIDSDGMKTGGRVRATLRRAARGTNVAESLGTCDSDTSDATGPTEIFCPLPKPVDLSDKYQWWWEVVIDRSDPAVNVEFLGLISGYTTP